MANKHISYRQFKNIFGDLGVTYWTKYNWLSNGLPDGWARVIFNGSEDWVQNSHGSFSTPLANSVSNAEGTSKECACNELPIKSWNEDVGSTTDSVGLTWAQVGNHAQAFIRINGISDANSLKTYLTSHPITFYYKMAMPR